MPFVQGDGAFKIFANGVLVTQCGVPGRRETPSVRSTSAYTIANSFSSDQEGTIVLVHEVGDLHNGGIFEVPQLDPCSTNLTFSYTVFGTYMSITVLGGFLLIAMLLASTLAIGFSSGRKALNIST
jgi:hypothetical protein